MNQLRASFSLLSVASGRRHAAAAPTIFRNLSASSDNPPSQSGRKDEEDITSDVTDKTDKAQSDPGTMAKEAQGDPGTVAKETIIQRLTRLSQSSPEEFAPSKRPKEEVKAAKDRYKKVLEEYNSSYAREDFLRKRSFGMANKYARDRDDYRPNYVQGGRSTPWRDFTREFSTSSAREANDDNITERLRKLSENSGENVEKAPRNPFHRDKKENDDNWGQGSSQDYQPRKWSSSNNKRSESWKSNNSYRKGDYDNNSYRKGDYDNNSYRKGEYDQRKPSGSRRWGSVRTIDEHLEPPPRPQRYPTPAMEKVRERVEEYGFNSPEEIPGRENTLKRRDGKRDLREVYWKHEQRTPKSTVGDYQKVLSTKKKKDTATTPAKIVNEADVNLSSDYLGDPDTFGTLSVGPIPVKDHVGREVKKELLREGAELGLGEGIGIHAEEGDDVREIPLPGTPEKWNMDKLTNRVQLLIQEMKVKEAVDTLFSALAAGGFNFDPYKLQYVYKLCISGCAQVGYVAMAFRLFNDQKKRDFRPRINAYTSLFNACANAPWDAEKNLERMANLRENMVEKGIVLNHIVYHAMIKGYGRNGAISDAFAIVDEMVSLGLSPNTETFNMLLQACITDDSNGFRHLLVTWRKMSAMGVPRDIYTYNLVLRAIRETRIIPSPDLIAFEKEEKRKVRESSSDEALTLTVLPPVTTDAEANDMLDLLCLNSPLALQNVNNRLLPSGQKVSYKDLITALNISGENRLAVFGGLRGIMSSLACDKVGPNLKTMTELGLLTPPSDLGDLFMLFKTYKLKPDIVFFNLMIKRYTEQGNTVGARKVLSSLGQFGLSPNIMTWGVMTLTCDRKEKALQLLQEMDEAKFTPNIQVLGGLMSAAIREYDPSHVLLIMDEAKKREVEPSPKFVLQVAEFKQTVRKGILAKEMGKPVTPPRLAEVLEDPERFERAWRPFLFRYEDWVKNTKIKLEEEDPWAEEYQNFIKNKSHGTLFEEADDEKNKAEKSV